MTISKRTGLAGFFIAVCFTLSSCGSSSTSVTATDLDSSSTEDGSSAQNDADTENQSGSDSDSTVTTNSTDTTDTSGSSDTPADDTPADVVAIDSTSGIDLSGGDDDSPTATESASLVGPFVKDTTRSAGPPSTPSGLTALMTSYDWVEFSWIPSTDDQSVEEYEIYRDGQLISSIRGDTGNPFNDGNWITTSFMDCNYTRSAACVTLQPADGASYSYSVVAIDNEGMRSAASAPAVFTLEERTSQSVDLTGYSEVFSEEFNGSVLDRSLWKTSLPWGPDTTINRELQYYVNTFGSNPAAYDPFTFTGETLKITGINTPSDIPASSVNNKAYLSGVISTSDNFAMTYGYVEMSARVASGEGLLSTFYLFNQDFEGNSPEIDILEYQGSTTNKTYHTYHYYDSNRARDARGDKHSTPTMETVLTEDMSQAFHTYGVMWEEGLVVWYIDGQEVRRITGPRVSDEPMNIILQQVIGSEWIGSPTAASLPAVFEIDYVRVWQR